MDKTVAKAGVGGLTEVEVLLVGTDADKLLVEAGGLAAPEGLVARLSTMPKFVRERGPLGCSVSPGGGWSAVLITPTAWMALKVDAACRQQFRGMWETPARTHVPTLPLVVAIVADADALRARSRADARLAEDPVEFWPGDMKDHTGYNKLAVPPMLRPQFPAETELGNTIFADQTPNGCKLIHQSRLWLLFASRADMGSGASMLAQFSFLLKDVPDTRVAVMDRVPVAPAPTSKIVSLLGKEALPNNHSIRVVTAFHHPPAPGGNLGHHAGVRFDELAACLDLLATVGARCTGPPAVLIPEPGTRTGEATGFHPACMSTSHILHRRDPLGAMQGEASILGVGSHKIEPYNQMGPPGVQNQRYSRLATNLHRAAAIPAHGEEPKMGQLWGRGNGTLVWSVGMELAEAQDTSKALRTVGLLELFRVLRTDNSVDTMYRVCDHTGAVTAVLGGALGPQVHPVTDLGAGEDPRLALLAYASDASRAFATVPPEADTKEGKKGGGKRAKVEKEDDAGSRVYTITLPTNEGAVAALVRSSVSSPPTFATLGTPSFPISTQVDPEEMKVEAKHPRSRSNADFAVRLVTARTAPLNKEQVKALVPPVGRSGMDLPATGNLVSLDGRMAPVVLLCDRKVPGALLGVWLLPIPQLLVLFFVQPGWVQPTAGPLLRTLARVLSAAPVKTRVRRGGEETAGAAGEGEEEGEGEGTPGEEAFSGRVESRGTRADVWATKEDTRLFSTAEMLAYHEGVENKARARGGTARAQMSPMGMPAVPVLRTGQACLKVTCWFSISGPDEVGLQGVLMDPGLMKGVPIFLHRRRNDVLALLERFGLQAGDLRGFAAAFPDPTQPSSQGPGSSTGGAGPSRPNLPTVAFFWTTWGPATAPAQLEGVLFMEVREVKGDTRLVPVAMSDWWESEEVGCADGAAGLPKELKVPLGDNDTKRAIATAVKGRGKGKGKGKSPGVDLVVVCIDRQEGEPAPDLVWMDPEQERARRLWGGMVTALAASERVRESPAPVRASWLCPDTPGLRGWTAGGNMGPMGAVVTGGPGWEEGMAAAKQWAEAVEAGEEEEEEEGGEESEDLDLMEDEGF